MTTSRRQFLTFLAGAGAALGSSPIRALVSRTQASTGYFGLHPFIDQHPEAVFIMKTTVDQKMNADAKLTAGLAFGRSVFVPRDLGGVPINTSIPIKPNLKTADPNVYPIETIIGHVADPFFVEGMLNGMKELGIAGSQFHLREVNRPEAWGPHFYVDMAKRVGADLRLDLAPTITSLVQGRDYNWTEVKNGMYFLKIPHLEPINTPNTWMLNISKFKAHGMGLTLCLKNLQGSAAHNYQQFCSAYNTNMSMSSEHYRADWRTVVKKSYDDHYKSIPRWDRPGQDALSGIGMETWVHRTLDNVSSTPCALHIIEGIYGRDGQGNGDLGPNPQNIDHNFDDYGRSTTGKAWDWMSNVIIFGKDPYRVDIIGHWVGGHEAGNMGLFHIARERGFSTALDPRRIPVYVWDNGQATLTPLAQIQQTPLLTYYMPRNYNGQTEKIYHLLNEPFDYSPYTGVEENAAEKPESFVLSQNRPNPFNPYTTIEYDMPRAGNVRLEVYNANGQLASVLVDGWRAKGSHMAVWNANGSASGTYLYRFRCGDFTRTGKMVLLK